MARKTPYRSLGILAVLGLLVGLQAFLIGEDLKLGSRAHPIVTVVQRAAASAPSGTASALRRAPVASPPADSGTATLPTVSIASASSSAPPLLLPPPHPPPGAGSTSQPAPHGSEGAAGRGAPRLAQTASWTDGSRTATATREGTALPVLGAPALTTQDFIVAPEEAPPIRPAMALQQRESPYRVRSGDTLFAIARRFHLSAEALRNANRLTGSVLAVGQVLAIPAAATSDGGAGMRLHAIREGETAVDIARVYRVPLIDIVTDNDLADLYHIPAGTLIRVRTRRLHVAAAPSSVGASVDERHVAAAHPRPPTARALATRQGFSPPIHGRISSTFGYREHPILRECRFHGGVDIPGERGEPVHAAASGQVVFAGWQPGLGKAIAIRHGSGFVTRYGHCSRLLRHRGDWVKRGETIALVGSTGLSTGPHLHFEIQRNGKLQNPLKYIASASFRPPAP